MTIRETLPDYLDSVNQFPFGYERIEEASWAYLSSLLMIALFFKFNRFWTMRNLDLFLVILLAPGLIMVYAGLVAEQRTKTHGAASELVADVNPSGNANIVVQDGQDPKEGQGVPESGSGQSGQAANRDVRSTADEGLGSEASANAATGAQSGVRPPPLTDDMTAGVTPDHALSPAVESTLTGSQRLQRLGYVWLFSVGGLFLVRLLLDPVLVRRPLLEPNLSIGGMVFLGCSLMTFIFADVIAAPVKSETGDPRVNGPGYRWLQSLPVIDTFSDRMQVARESGAVSGEHANESQRDSENRSEREAIEWESEWAAKSLVIATQFAIVCGLILLGFYHFSNFRSGVAMACIYLMLPYTVFFSGHSLHLLPGALLIWALVAYRRPFWSGLLIGMAAGVAYYPIFLLPLWFSFYWDKGALRFALGVLLALAICISGLWLTAADNAAWFSQLRQMFGFWLPVMEGLRGIWSLGWDANFRLPILVGFLVLAISFVFWPARKNAGTLIAYSAAIMIAVQFWHGFGGGLYMAWYLPLALGAFFRPNLADRDAVSQLGDGWLRRFRRVDTKHSATTSLTSL